MFLRNIPILNSLIAVLFALSFSVAADNGALAKAFPVEAMTIDGDPSDWQDIPEDYALNEFLGGAQQTLQSYFKAAYNINKQSLYILLAVKESAYYLSDAQSSTSPWEIQDTHLLYLQFEHHKRWSAPTLYASNGSDFIADVTENSWDPRVRNQTPNKANMAVKRSGDVTYYEWHIQLDEQTKAGDVLGIDHVLADFNEKGTAESYWAWGKFTPKTGRAGRLGDLILYDPSQPTGKLVGNIKWQTGVEGSDLSGRRVLVEQKDKPAFSVVFNTDESRRFEIELPVGYYRVRSPFEIYGEDHEFRLIDEHARYVEVKANKTTDMQDFTWQISAPPPITSREKLLFNYQAADEKRVDNFITEYMHHYHVPGASVALISKGQVVYQKTFGVKNFLTREAVGQHTIFDAGSLTKTVFAFAVNKLAERGEIDLDKPLYQYLTFDAIAEDERSKLITARHVLSHQTGFPNWANGSLTINFTPGTDFGYSGEGFEYLRRVISKITGKAYEQILVDEVLKPMGLTSDIQFSNKGKMIEVVANGHDLNRPYTFQLPEEARAAYTMHTESRIFSNFMLNLMNRKGLSQAQYAKMLSPNIRSDWDSNGWPIDYGLGFQLVQSPYGLAFGHSGENFGSLSLYEIYDEHDAGFVIFTNSASGGEMMRAFRRFLVSGGKRG